MAMVIPDTYPLTIIRGREFSVTFEFVALNLSGYTVKAQVRELENQSSTLIADFTEAVVTGTNSTVTLSLSDTTTSAITQSTGFYDILMTDGSNNDYTYVRGPVQIIGSVTVKG